MKAGSVWPVSLVVRGERQAVSSPGAPAAVLWPALLGVGGLPLLGVPGLPRWLKASGRHADASLVTGLRPSLVARWPVTTGEDKKRAGPVSQSGPALESGATITKL